MVDFYEAGAFQRVATNLFYGWGYNFYRKENQLRADDLMVRSKVSEILSDIRRTVSAAEGAFRTEFLPPLTRDSPRPDAEALRKARVIEGVAASVTALEGRIRALPVPENDRMTQRYRKEAETLQRLLQADYTFVGGAETLRVLLQGKDAGFILESLSIIKAHLDAIESSVRDRASILSF